MTIDEAIKTLKENCCAMCAYTSYDMDSCDISSCDNKDAIKVLEQESFMDKVKVLEKIRDEIVHLHDWAFSREEILRIIDKYKTNPTSEDSTCDSCKTPCIMYEKGMRKCNQTAEESEVDK